MRAGKGLILFISIEDMDDIIKIVEPLEKLCLLTDDVTETVKHEMIKQEVDFLGALMALMAFSLIQPLASSLINAITGK